MMKVIEGIGVSDGIAFAKAFLFDSPHLTVEKKHVSDVGAEKERLNKALEQAKEELQVIREQAREELGEDKAAIFSAHLLVLEDPELIGPIEEKIETEQVNAEYALEEVAQSFIAIFETMDNEYMKERAADIRDVTKRVTAHLLGVDIPNLGAIAEDVILIAKDLTPSETAQLNPHVQAFVTDIGGRTSHSAIMARSMEIPAVVGTKTATAQIQSGQFLLVDGREGKVIIDPPAETIEAYQAKRLKFQEQKAEWAKLVDQQTLTRDGQQLELAANIGSPADVAKVLENGAEGIGLYRTEFLYMEREQLPTEEEQFEAYKTVLERMDGKPVVIRTLDIGGDKELHYLSLPEELNPFLGFRAIRLCLQQEDMFRSQLRALLRASMYGNLKIMFPMVATLEELRQAKALLQEEKHRLQAEGIAVSEQIEIGIMVEIPSTAVLADQFAPEVDFFSIGTNDLIQYTLAADRMNETVSYLYQPYHPAVLRLVKMVIDAAHRTGKWAGMCGEMAGDEVAIPILVGMGLDEFSMSASSILPARYQVRHLEQQELRQHVDTLLHMGTAQDVEEYVRRHLLSGFNKQ
jgi:phosphotransferase system enzyme I (PtsI)